MKTIDVLLSTIEPEHTKEMWFTFLEEERLNVRLRFGDDEEAMKFFPDNYYDKMEQWWATESRRVEPLFLYYDTNNILRIEDGWHRVAISHKLGLIYVPAIITSGILLQLKELF